MPRTIHSLKLHMAWDRRWGGYYAATAVMPRATRRSAALGVAVTISAPTPIQLPISCAGRNLPTNGVHPVMIVSWLIEHHLPPYAAPACPRGVARGVNRRSQEATGDPWGGWHDRKSPGRTWTTRTPASFKLAHVILTESGTPSVCHSCHDQRPVIDTNERRRSLPADAEISTSSLTDHRR